YTRVPQVLAVDNLPSLTDGNNSLLVINRLSSGAAANGAFAASTLGSMTGVLFDDADGSHGFSFTGGVQLRSTISDSFPRTAMHVSSIIPSGHTGWLKFSSPNNNAVLGALLNYNPNTASSASAFKSGHNLRYLTLASTATMAIPVYAPTFKADASL